MSSRIRKAAAIGLASLLGALAALLAPMVSSSAPTASALSDCSAPIEEAIFQATGQHTGQASGAGLACNSYIYAPNGYTSQSDLQAKVNEVFSRCGNTVAGRYIVLALLETTGRPPEAGVVGLDNVCHQRVYNEWWMDTASSGGSPSVNFAVYEGNAGSSEDIDTYSAVHGVMSVCGQSIVSHAVVSVIDRYPITDPVGNNPNLHFPTGLVSRGQCDPALYNHGVWSGYSDLKQRVVARAYSTENCPVTEITDAYQALSNWKPLPDECNVARYGNGSWGTYQELVNRVYHSLRCDNEWLGQAYAFGAPNRRINGKGEIGECNSLLYKDSIYVSYADTLARVQTTTGTLAQQDVVIERDGDLVRSGVETDAAKVLVGSQTGAPAGATLNGRFFRDANGGLVMLISDKGLGVISTGGGNVISSDGASFVSNNNGNFISNNTGTLVSEAVGSLKAFDVMPP